MIYGVFGNIKTTIYKLNPNNKYLELLVSAPITHPAINPQLAHISIVEEQMASAVPESLIIVLGTKVITPSPINNSF